MTIAINGDPVRVFDAVSNRAMSREADTELPTSPDSKALVGGDDADKFAAKSVITNEVADFQLCDTDSNVRGIQAELEVSQCKAIKVSSSKKSVAFASTKRVRQFGVDTSTNYPEEEMDVDFESVSKLRARKAAKLTNNRIKSQTTSSVSVANLLGLSDAAAIQFKHEPEAKSIFLDESRQTRSDDRTAQKTPIKVAILHSNSHTQILHQAMQHIHRDRDLLLASLLKWCGFINGASKGGAISSFLSIVPPNIGTKALLQEYHDCDYLDMLQFPQFPSQLDEKNNDENDLQEKLARYGLEDDCPLPTSKQSHTILWNYCLAVSGASCDAASLLINQEADVSIHWGGGRHHAHKNKAGGFCYVNDIVLAVRRLLSDNSNGIKSVRRVLYIDLDIHHPDGVQSAFYDTDAVLTASFHRHAAGFFPATSGSISEKGQSGSRGLGYNLNIPLPAGVGDTTFLYMYQKLLFDLVNVYEPHAIVLCVGADGLAGDALVNGDIFDTDDNNSDDFSFYMRSESYGSSSSTREGWSLSPECLAECVRIAAAFCAGDDKESICALTSSKTEFDVRGGITDATTSHSNEHIDTTHDSSVKEDHEQGIPLSAKLDNEAKLTSNAVIKQEEAPRQAAPTPGIVNRKGIRRKLMVLGGGGYSPSQVSRTWLLCTAAACEGARPGMFWHELPKDIPNHCYFPRYGPAFELVSDEKREEFFEFYSSLSRDQVNPVNAELSHNDRDVLQKGLKAIDLACLYIERQRKKANNVSSTYFSYESAPQEDEWWSGRVPRKSKGSQTVRRGRRKKSKQLSSDIA